MKNIKRHIHDINNIKCEEREVKVLRISKQLKLSSCQLNTDGYNHKMIYVSLMITTKILIEDTQKKM